MWFSHRDGIGSLTLLTVLQGTTPPCPSGSHLQRPPLPFIPDDENSQSSLAGNDVSGHTGRSCLTSFPFTQMHQHLWGKKSEHAIGIWEVQELALTHYFLITFSGLQTRVHVPPEFFHDVT